MNEAASAPIGQRARVARRIAALAVLLAASALAPGLTEPWLPARELAFARATGLVACLVLLCTLAVTPLDGLRSARTPRVAILRRALGMATAWLALLHAVVAFVGPLRAEPAALLQTSHLYAGITALGILLLLLLTSFAGVVRVLRLRFWKELHRLSYVALLLVVQHVALSSGADRRLVLGLLASTALLFALRVATAWRRRMSTFTRGPADPRAAPPHAGPRSAPDARAL